MSCAVAYPNGLWRLRGRFATAAALAALAAVRLCAVPASAQDGVVINEFLAINDSVLADENGDYSDWVEIYNGATVTVDLAGWSLTDDPDDLAKWSFPQMTLSTGEYLVVFASGEDRRDAEGELHTNFKLSGGGEYLALVKSNGLAVVHEYDPVFPEQLADISYGISTNAGGQLLYFTTPTPDGPNVGETMLGEVADTKFSVDRGFYSRPFTVAITTETPGAEIRYTVDGSTPNEVHGALYSGPVSISGTTTLRAVAYRPGYRPSDIDTQTYIFLSDVLTQPPDPPGFPASWKGTTADYEMDPDILNHPDYGSRMEESLLSLPSISIVTDIDNLFHPTTGIYANSGAQGRSWERPASIEYIDPGRRREFQLNAGLRIYGGAFRGMGLTRKKTFRVLFKSDYGPGKLDFPLFEADTAKNSFDTIILRAGANDGWNNWGKEKTQYIVDEFMRRTQLALGQPSCHGTFVHLYLNGLYWGLYNAVERPQASFCARYFGGDKEEWDALNSGAATGDGNTQTWGQMLAQVRAGLVDNAAYQKIQGNNPDRTPNPAYDHLLDVPNNIDYMYCNFWGGTGDWPGHNWYSGCRRPPNATGFKFFNWDSEGAIHIWSSLNANRTGVNNSAAEPYAELRKNAEYKLLFGDHAYRHLFHDGATTPAAVHARYSNLADSVESAIIAESARWGDQAGRQHTLAQWQAERDRVLNNYMPFRSGVVLGQLRNAGLYPTVDAPEFNQHGGLFTNGFGLTMTADEAVYFTTDMTDPREYGTGQAVGALYTTPIPLSHSLLVKARARSGSGVWSALHEVLFAPEYPQPLRVSELMYNPRDPRGTETNGSATASCFEFVEIVNAGTVTVGLAGVTISGGIDFDFTTSPVRTLGAGEYVLVVRDLAAFTNRYPDAHAMRVAGEYGGTLDNGGERLTLTDGAGRRVLSFEYSDDRGWPPAADGAGHSLVPLVLDTQPADALDYGGHWRRSTAIDGSPGRADPEPWTHLVLNEVLAHTDYSDPGHPEYDSNDRIELYNASNAPVPLAGWYLSDDRDYLAKWQIPATSTVPALGWIVFDEVTGFHSPITNGFGLDKGGEELFLSYLPGSTNDGVVDCVRFKGQENGRALGRYPDGGQFWYSLSPTLGGANAPPDQTVAISKIMYHPLPTIDNPENNENDEYVEIHNSGTTPVNLWNAAGPWRLDGDTEYTFPAGVTLASGERIVLVTFEPENDAEEMRGFRNAHGVSHGQVRLFGPWSGELSNRGGRVALERPQAPDPPGTEVSWVIVDEAIYFDRAPWPTGSDRTGKPIARLATARSGRDPSNWQTAFSSAPGLPADAVLIMTPAYGETALLGSSIPVEATVNPAAVSGHVQAVEFFADGRSIGTDTTEPYAVMFGPVTNVGSHRMAAVVTVDAGTCTSRATTVFGTAVYADTPTNVTSTWADMTGSLSDEGVADICIYWGPSDAGTNRTAWSNVVALGRQRGSFVTEANDLVSSATYSYRCLATNCHGATWSDTAAAFTTLPPNAWLSVSGSPFSEHGGTATVATHLSNVSASNVTVHLAFAGVAVPGTDYTCANTSIVVVAGQSTASTTLTGVDNTQVEGTRTFEVAIGSAHNAFVATTSAVPLAIISDDPQIVNGSASGVGDSIATLHGTLTHGNRSGVTVYWGTNDGGTNSAAWEGTNSLGNLDEGAFSTRLTGLKANRRYHYRCFTANGGGSDWADTTVDFHTLPPRVSARDVTILEGDAGTSDALFAVTLSAPSAVDVSVDYATSNGTATAGDDFTAVAGRLTILAGEAGGTLAVPVIGDGHDEWPSEDFSVELSSPSNCVLADGQAIATIEDDDAYVRLVNWQYRAMISFPGYDRSERLAHFPVAVELGTNVPSFTYGQLASADGADLRFATSNLTSLLYWEFEHWDTNGQSLVWVRLPELAASNTTIWAYWGNPSVTGMPAHATGGDTWDDGFVGVWHMNELDTPDATRGGHDGTDKGSVTRVGMGIVAGACSFDADSDYIAVPDSPEFTLSGTYSVSAWIRSDGIGNQHEAFVGTHNGNGFIFSLQNNTANTLRFWADGRWCSSDRSIPDGRWTYVAYTRSGSAGRFYIDGTLVRSRSDAIAIDNGGQLQLGGGGTSWGSNRFDGMLDEVRMSAVERSPNWVWASWLNTASNAAFVSYGAAEPVNPDMPFITAGQGATNVTADSAWLTARVVSTGAAETAVWVYWGTEDGGQPGTEWANTGSLGNVSGEADWYYTTNVTGLIPNARHYYACRAANVHGAMWAGEIFDTYGPPHVAQHGVTNVGVGTATLRGRLTTPGPAVVTVYWGDTDGGTNPAAWRAGAELGAVDGPGLFHSSPSGLLYGVRYHFRCQATNVYGSAWSDGGAFLTRTSALSEPGLVATAYDTAWGDAYLDPISNLEAEEADGTYPFAGVINYGNYSALRADYPALTDQNNYSVMWQGVFRADTATYTFGTESDDGSVLYLDLNADGDFDDSGEMIVNNKGAHGARQRTGSVTLERGEVALATAFYERGGGEVMRVRWKKGVGLDYGALDRLDCSSGDFHTGFGLASVGIANSPATNITAVSAECAGLLQATGAVFDVFVQWGASDGGSNAAAWDATAFVGSYTDAPAAEIRYLLTGLSTNTAYYYTFRATNAAADIWAAPVTDFTSSALEDTDGDGLPDWWEIRHCRDLKPMHRTSDADGDGALDTWEYRAGCDPKVGDTDGDGMSDGDEFVAATSPTNAADRFRITGTAQDAGGIVIWWPSATGRMYTVRSATNLLTPAWQDVHATPGDGEVRSYTNTQDGHPVHLYRLKVETAPY